MMIEVTKDYLTRYPINTFQWSTTALIPLLINCVVKHGGTLTYDTKDKVFIATQVSGKCWVSSFRHQLGCYWEFPEDFQCDDSEYLSMSSYDRLRLFITEIDHGWSKCVLGDASYFGTASLVKCVCLDCANVLMLQALKAIPKDYKGQIYRILDIIVGKNVPRLSEEECYARSWMLASNMQTNLRASYSDALFARSPAKTQSPAKTMIDIDKVMLEVDIMTGLEFEEFLQELFQKMGYDVSLTPNSGDFGTDLILEKDGLKTSVQAKRYNAQVGITAMQEAIAGAAFYECDYSMVITNSNYTKAAEEFAKKTGVIIWQRSDIQKALSEL